MFSKIEINSIIFNVLFALISYPLKKSSSVMRSLYAIWQAFFPQVWAYFCALELEALPY